MIIKLNKTDDVVERIRTAIAKPLEITICDNKFTILNIDKTELSTTDKDKIKALDVTDLALNIKEI